MAFWRKFHISFDCVCIYYDILKNFSSGNLSQSHPITPNKYCFHVMYFSRSFFHAILGKVRELRLFLCKEIASKLWNYRWNNALMKSFAFFATSTSSRINCVQWMRKCHQPISARSFFGSGNASEKKVRIMNSNLFARNRKLWNIFYKLFAIAAVPKWAVHACSTYFYRLRPQFSGFIYQKNRFSGNRFNVISHPIAYSTFQIDAMPLRFNFNYAAYFFIFFIYTLRTRNTIQSNMHLYMQTRKTTYS